MNTDPKNHNPIRALSHPEQLSTDNNPRAQADHQITSQVIHLLERGIVPWESPGLANPRAFYPANYCRRQYFRGINVFLLAAIAHERNYSSLYWATEEELKALRFTHPPTDEATTVLRCEEGREPQAIQVHNLDRCHCDQPHDPVHVGCPWAINDPAKFVKECSKKWGPNFRSARVASYDSETDTIRIPNSGRAKSRDAYYSGVFCLLAISAAHPENDLGIQLPRWDDWATRYDLTHLTIAMARGLLCRETGIRPTPGLWWNESSSPSHWIDALTKDASLLRWACDDAEKIFDFIWNTFIDDGYPLVSFGLANDSENRPDRSTLHVNFWGPHSQ